mgnify:CR=1 FL=1
MMKTIQITIDEQLLAHVDEHARHLGVNRSSLVRESLQHILQEANIRRLEERYSAGYVAQPQTAEELWFEPTAQDVLSPELATKVEHFFPGKTLDQVVMALLLERAQRQLIAFQRMAQQFEAKYVESFDSFRARILSGAPDEVVEQDYFDWEMAITAAEDLRTELDQLRQRQL